MASTPDQWLLEGDCKKCRRWYDSYRLQLVRFEKRFQVETRIL